MFKLVLITSCHEFTIQNNDNVVLFTFPPITEQDEPPETQTKKPKNPILYVLSAKN